MSRSGIVLALLLVANVAVAVVSACAGSTAGILYGTLGFGACVVGLDA